MSDRELLELAAKASGMDYLVWTPGASPIVPAPKRIGGQMVWNPIHSDGDALRLAAKLNLDIRFSWYDDTTAVFVGGTWDNAPEAVHELFERDVAASMRRAIVRAAAAIAAAQEA
ncbi:hypothetical protein FOC27_09290 [Burkholderia multivorans]|uniref:hypothetical protein n=1 Tax=Burkholderia multivorans TaxID=87883 RepID=UPI0011B1E3DE|nr:hypothetical protein [Burkholderia multivorans]QGR60400.1 hypothetical protein FOC27_09290 [Burkholderia multivorans]